MRILFIGDVIGRPGRQSVQRLLPELKEEYAVDLTIANGENSAGGLGATPKTIHSLLSMGVDLITLGNHAWRKKELVKEIHLMTSLVRPANYPPKTPGVGGLILPVGGVKVGLINLQGRIYMDPIDCPFRTADAMIEKLQGADIFFVDFHAEATSEKAAMGAYLDGRVAAVVGTHTHVPTADESILPGGTAFITDVGMAGPIESIIGVTREIALSTFVTRLPARFTVADGPCRLDAVVIDVDASTGLAKTIERVSRFLTQSEVEKQSAS